MIRAEVTNRPVSYSDVMQGGEHDQRPDVERGDDRRERHREGHDRQAPEVVAREGGPRQVGAGNEERHSQQGADADQYLHGEERRERRARSRERHHAHDQDHLLENLAKGDQPVAKLDHQRQRQGGLSADQRRAGGSQGGAGDHL